MNQNSSVPAITRRRALYFAAVAPAGVALAACGSSGGDDPSAALATTSTASQTPDCVFTPEEIEGPFYANVNLMRRDITDNKAGAPLELQLRVVDADTCSPIVDATVDIWHADADGVYSAFPGQGDSASIDTSGESFLRGVQATDVDGLTTFASIYPGWYRGRTTHVHVKVHFDDNTRVTSQLYFPDQVTAVAYATASYSARGPKDTSNENDDFSAANPALRMTVTESGGSFVAVHTLGIRR